MTCQEYNIFEGKRRKFCREQNCLKCPYRGSCPVTGNPISEKMFDFISFEYESTDWTKIAVDTKIYVRDVGSADWTPRHFAKYEDGKVYVWPNGETSFTHDTDKPRTWQYAVLADALINDYQ